MSSGQAIVDAEEPVRHVLTVDDFLKLDGAGAFSTLGIVELVDGEIFVLSPLYSPHGRATADLCTDINMAIRRAHLELVVHSPVSAWMDEHSLPQPDIVVTSTAADKWVTPDMVRLVVEVSQSTLRHEMQRKAALYARGGVPEYWIADLKGRRIVRMHQPAGERYGERAEFAFGDTVPSATIDALTVDTTALV